MTTSHETQQENKAPPEQCCDICGRDTRFGSGLFVNRIPADVGYICPDCAALDCDRCGKPIEADTEVKPYDVYPEGDKRQHQDFGDGAYIVHEECLTADENQAYIKKAEEN